MKIKLLYLPRFEIDYNTGEPLDGVGWYEYYIPPISTPILTSFLRQHNIDVDQDDLMIKACRKGMDLSLFAEEDKKKKFIKKGYEEHLEKEGEKILDLTNCKGYDVFGFSVYEPDNPTTGSIALVLAKLLKEKYGSTIIFGGRGLGGLRETLLKSDFIDYAILHKTFEAPAELNLLKFCEHYENGDNLEKTVPGLEYIKNGKRKENPTNYNKKEVPQFTMPCFEGLPLDLYRYKLSRDINGEVYESKILILPYFFVKGCPNECAFCCNSVTDYLTKPIEKVLEELKYFKDKYKTNCFFFLNPEVNPTYPYGEALAEELKDLNIRWAGSATLSMDKKLLKKLKQAGAVRLIFGLETASSKMLKYIEKFVKPEQAEKVLKWSYDLKIWAVINLICGFPYERSSDIDKTIKFLERNKKYIRTTFINKFFLDGKIKHFPEQYGVKIRKKSSPGLLEEDWRGGFDEIEGLNWMERRKLTDESFNRILNAINKLGIKRGSAVHEAFFQDSLPDEIKERFYFN